MRVWTQLAEKGFLCRLAGLIVRELRHPRRAQSSTDWFGHLLRMSPGCGGGGPGMSSWEKSPKQTQDTLEGELQLSCCIRDWAEWEEKRFWTLSAPKTAVWLDCVWLYPVMGIQKVTRKSHFNELLNGCLSSLIRIAASILVQCMWATTPCDLCRKYDLASSQASKNIIKAFSLGSLETSSKHNVNRLSHYKVPNTSLPCTHPAANNSNLCWSTHTDKYWTCKQICCACTLKICMCSHVFTFSYSFNTANSCFSFNPKGPGWHCIILDMWFARLECESVDINTRKVSSQYR